MEKRKEADNAWAAQRRAVAGAAKANFFKKFNKLPCEKTMEDRQQLVD